MKSFLFHFFESFFLVPFSIFFSARSLFFCYFFKVISVLILYLFLSQVVRSSAVPLCEIVPYGDPLGDEMSRILKGWRAYPLNPFLVVVILFLLNFLFLQEEENQVNYTMLIVPNTQAVEKQWIRVCYFFPTQIPTITTIITKLLGTAGSSYVSNSGRVFSRNETFLKRLTSIGDNWFDLVFFPPQSPKSNFKKIILK